MFGCLSIFEGAPQSHPKLRCTYTYCYMDPSPQKLYSKNSIKGAHESTAEDSPSMEGSQDVGKVAGMCLIFQMQRRRLGHRHFFKDRTRILCPHLVSSQQGGLQ